MSKALITFLLILAFLIVSSHTVSAATYYLSPSGNDGAAGTSETTAWATFNRAFNSVTAGDTVLLLDGTYKQALYVKKSGSAGKPITFRAKNDGKVTIDGEHVREPVEIPGWQGYITIEGIITINGGRTAGKNEAEGSNFKIDGDYNILRRISSYNADTDGNTHGIVLGQGSNNNLIEDCISAGTGRKMLMAYHSDNNVIRRCFTDWHEWQGRDSCQIWPWGENIDLYESNNNIVENSIGYGSVPLYSFTVRTNDTKSTANDNKLYGNIAAYAGMDKNGNGINWPTTHPQPSSCTSMRDWKQAGYRSGFTAYNYSGTPLQNLVWKDLYSWGNAGHGLTKSSGGPNLIYATIDHVTVKHNGLDNGYGGNTVDGPIGRDVDISRLESNFKITNSYIEGTSYQGSGARLENRYVNGTLTSQPLWPWPMDDRAKAEYQRFFGISNFTVTNEIYNKVLKGSPITPQPTQVQPPTPLPTTPSPTTPTQRGDFDGDGDTDILDLFTFIPFYDSTSHCQYNLTGSSTICTISIFDFNALIAAIFKQ